MDASACVGVAAGSRGRPLQLLATSSALSAPSAVLSRPPRARQIFTVRSLGDRKRKWREEAVGACEGGGGGGVLRRH